MERMCDGACSTLSVSIAASSRACDVTAPSPEPQPLCDSPTPALCSKAFAFGRLMATAGSMADAAGAPKLKELADACAANSTQSGLGVLRLRRLNDENEKGPDAGGVEKGDAPGENDGEGEVLLLC